MHSLFQYSYQFVFIIICNKSMASDCSKRQVFFDIWIERIHIHRSHLQLTNTFYKHKPAQLSTWTCLQRNQEIIDSNSGTNIRNPHRNQIGYILIRKYRNTTVHDSRSYGGFTCNSDHKPVIAKLKLNWKMSKRRPKPIYQKSNHRTSIKQKNRKDSIKT